MKRLALLAFLAGSVARAQDGEELPKVSRVHDLGTLVRTWQIESAPDMSNPYPWVDPDSQGSGVILEDDWSAADTSPLSDFFHELIEKSGDSVEDSDSDEEGRLWLTCSVPSHVLVEKSIEALRRALLRRVHVQVEALLVDSSSLQALSNIPIDLSSTDIESIRQLTRNGGKRLGSLGVTRITGQRGVASEIRTRPLVVDAEPQVAENAGTWLPVKAEVRLGMVLGCTARLSPDAASALVSLRVQYAEAGKQSREAIGGPGSPPIDFLQRQAADWANEFSCPLDRAVAFAVRGSSQAFDGRTLVLIVEVSAVDAEAPAVAIGATPLLTQWIETSTLETQIENQWAPSFHPRRELSNGASTEMRVAPPPPFEGMDTGELEERIRIAAAASNPEEDGTILVRLGTGVLVGNTEMAVQAGKDTMQKLYEHRANDVFVEFMLASATSSAPSEEDPKALAEAAFAGKNAAVLSYARTGGIGGVQQAVTAALEIPTIVEQSAEVAAGISLPNPTFCCVRDGAQFQYTAYVLEGRKSVRLDLSTESTRGTEVRRVPGGDRSGAIDIVTMEESPSHMTSVVTVGSWETLTVQGKVGPDGLEERIVLLARVRLREGR